MACLTVKCWAGFYKSFTMLQKVLYHQLNLIISFIIFFLILLIVSPNTYGLLSSEDHVFEYLSSILLGSTGIVMFIAFIKIKKQTNAFTIKNSLFLILTVIFFLVAGEEISWGQRIFNFETPNYLLSINDQNEFNFHNINKKFFDRVLDRITILFVLIATLLIFRKKESLWDIKTPNTVVICCFALSPFYNQYNIINFEFYHLLYIPLFLLLYKTKIQQDKTSLRIVITTLLMTILIPYIHIKYQNSFPINNNSANEYREFLFCMCCLFYSIQINLGINNNNYRGKI